MSSYLSYRGPLAPSYLQKAIQMRGGVNPYGLPNYRLIFSDERYEQVGGVWHDWDESLSVNDRNYINRKGEDLNKPLRVVEETRWVKKYPQEHKWILEKWVAPSFYGLPEAWYQTGTLGAYPYEGDYEATDYVFPNEALTEGIVLNAIGRLMHHLDGLPASRKGRELRQQYVAKQRDEYKERKQAKRDADIVSDTGYAFSGKPFVGYGDKHKSDIEATADRLGISNTSLK